MFKLGDKVEKAGRAIFRGTIVGFYTTLEGHEGAVVQVEAGHNCSGNVHVYPLEVLKPWDGLYAATHKTATGNTSPELSGFNQRALRETKQ